MATPDLTTSNYLQPSDVRVGCQCWVSREEGGPEVALRGIAEVARHHANHHETRVAQANQCTDSCGVRGKRALPQAMADDHDAVWRTRSSLL